MITTANYLLIAYVGGEQYHFEYEDCGDMWEALEQFWHEDYAETLMDKDSRFEVDVLAMDGGKCIRRYETAFDCAHYHAFFDHGHTVHGPYTLDEFNRNLKEIREKLNVRDNGPKPNDVTSFFYYMWNRWSEEECKVVFKDDYYPHFWNKWCEAYDTMKGPRGAAELFYMMLSDTNRDKLVARALELYDGMTEK